MDEAQFFGTDLLRLWERIEERNKGDALVVAGLDLDFERQRFGHVFRLIRLQSVVVRYIKIMSRMKVSHECHSRENNAPPSPWGIFCLSFGH